ncbi:MAG: response regulator transcription factor [Armatimonadetes bacterium]|nr:response regulator transcription factor [Armatimonadota bacterium]
MRVQALQSESVAVKYILLGSSSPQVLQELHRIVHLDPSFTVRNECTRPGELLAMLERSEPDVLVLDRDMANLSLLRNLLSRHPSLRIVILITEQPMAGYLGEAAATGVLGFVCKQAVPSLMIKALRAAATGHRWIQRELTDRLVQDYGLAAPAFLAACDPPLSQRQKEILVLLFKGLTNRAIAEHLCISEKTVKAHLTQLVLKLGVANRVGAVCFAIRQGLVHM